MLWWETDFRTPPVLGGAALLAVQHQQCIKIVCSKEPEFDGYKNQSSIGPAEAKQPQSGYQQANLHGVPCCFFTCSRPDH